MIKGFTLQKKVAIFFTLMVLLVVGNYALVVYSKQAYEENEVYAEISKQNSLQIQHIVFYTRNVTEGKKTNINDLIREMKVMDDNLKLLREGGVYEGVYTTRVGPATNTFAAQLADVERLWKDFRAQVVAVAEANPIRRDSVLVYVPAGRTQSDTMRVEFINPSVVPHLNYIIKNTEKLVLFNEDLADSYFEAAIEERNQHLVSLLMLALVTSVLLAAGYRFITVNTFEPLNKINTTAQLLASGDLTRTLDYQSHDEIGQVVRNINQLADSLEKISMFATDIGNGNFSSDFEVRGANDRLGYALLDMRENLKKVSEEDKRRNWANEGMAKFGDILRTNTDNLDELAYNIISNLVKYLDANQGGLFVLNEDSGYAYLTLHAAYAYNKKKYLERRVEIGQGLLGQAVLEKNPIYLTEIPNDYITITSGLGEANPNTLLVVPLKANDVIYGAIEIASFKELSDYQMDFVEKLSESIALTISAVKTRDKTKQLLEESQLFAEQMRAQEEEMRQNMEELAATQEEMRRVQLEIKEKETNLNAVINNTDERILALDIKYNVKVANKMLVDELRESGIHVMIGTNIMESLPQQQRNYWKIHYDRALRGETFSFVESFKTNDNEDEYMEVSLKPILSYEGEVEGISVFTRDITHLRPIRWED